MLDKMLNQCSNFSSSINDFAAVKAWMAFNCILGNKKQKAQKLLFLQKYLVKSYVYP